MGEKGLKLIIGLLSVIFGVAVYDLFVPVGEKTVKDIQHAAGQDEHIKVKIKRGPFKGEEIADINTYTGEWKLLKAPKKGFFGKKKGGKK